ncbi:MAG: amino acid adenylation domain-containing protein [Lachnospiraceae bacterium]|nr:amino acid adenylation domain-containing protein [uncultured Acetatifactor sp.]MCI8286985.1 amino acid adenylation domain-containing protein [Lachnospiraceae bacterium]
MQTHVLDYLREIVKTVPDKMAYSNGKESLTFREVYGQSRAIGTFLSDSGIYREPVVIFMNKHPKMAAAFFGVIWGGNYYVPVDVEMPESRIHLILENIRAKVMICDAGTVEVAERMAFDGKIVLYDEICHTGIKEAILQEIYEKALDTDPIYIVFTSGSTGIPKGVTACHRSVIDYIDHLSEALGFDENTVFGNQAPLYMDACLRELFSAVKFGASVYLIPKELFMLPVRLVEFMNEYQINTVCWVVSALTLISALGTFETVIPEYLRLIAFVSEAFPVKQFNKWKAAVPDAKYVNLYGPTEGTGVCCYYTVDREFLPGDIIPIGKPFKNTEILLLNEENERCRQGEEGEICIRGASLTLGYYNNPEKTAEAFVQNPLNSFYPELIYRTGDIGRINDRGELEFVSRRDYQIKHMGHRIELGEIEVNVNTLDGIAAAGCVYDKAKSKIVLYYSGETDEKALMVSLKERLPRYMLPGKIIRLEKLPYTANGKLDRMTLMKML